MQLRATSGTRRARSSSRLVRWLALALQVVAVMAMFDATGLASVLAAMSREAATADDCCADCPLEKSGGECPPSCPVCHCTHGSIAALPRAADPTDGELAIHSIASPPTPREATAPKPAPRSGVFRPPRHASTLA